MSQSIPYRRGFDRFASESELGPIEFEMALDIEEQARISEQKQHNLHGNWRGGAYDSDRYEGNQSNGEEESYSPLSRGNTSYLSPREVGHLSPNPEFKFPPETYVDLKEKDDMDPMKKPPQHHPDSSEDCSQRQSPSQYYCNKNDQLYTHHRLISEAESYTTHWENSILYDKDTNTRVSTPGFFQSRLKDKSPYLGPVGWTVPSKYYSATTRNPQRVVRGANTSMIDGGCNDTALVDARSSSPGENMRDRKIETIYHRRASRPFLIYQDPEWMAPPRGLTNAYFDSTASDDKENCAPDEREDRYDREESGGEVAMQLDGERLEQGDDSHGDDVRMDLDDDAVTVIMSSPSNIARRSREPRRYRHQRDVSSTSSSSIFHYVD
ncbi:hypothetical protein FQN49_000603 [Arthroderma sp. PD_2]|nr:hypothetical protein FQN49_000603 [Arthroderma sp. PD_2]